MDKDKVKIGIIGVGNMGSKHLTNILEGKCPELTVTAVADTNLERLIWAKEQDAAIVGVEDATVMLDSGLVDAVIVSVPHYDHPKYAMQAFARGIHVMCEKPAGVYCAQVREMNAAARSRKRGFWYDVQSAHQSTFTAKCGKLSSQASWEPSVRTNWIITNWYRPQAYYDSGAWRATWSGEAVAYCSTNVRTISTCGSGSAGCRFWSTPILHSVAGMISRWRMMSPLMSNMRMERRALLLPPLVICLVPTVLRLPLTVENVCDAKTLKLWKTAVPEPEFSRTNTKPFGSPKTCEIEVETDGYNPQHVGVLNAFAAAILRGEPLVADGREGIHGLTLSNAMHLSAWLGKPVTLPIDDTRFCDELMARVRISRRKEGVDGVIADTDGTYGS